VPFNFALVGAAGFVAPRHLKAIADTGNVLIAAADPHDSVGIIDSYFPDAAFFTEVERFDRFLEKRRRMSEAERVHYLSICSPNYLHDAHVRLALRVGAHAICEKPLVISPWNLDQLAALEQEYGRRVYTVLQLRLLPQLQELKRQLADQRDRVDVELTYITARGRWYTQSWKGVQEKSGGLALNIGVHFFDLLIWLYGRPERSEVHVSKPDKMSGTFDLERARVKWLLSVDRNDLPDHVRAKGKTAFRSLTSDGRELEFSDGFPDLHTAVYRDVLAGRGFSIDDVRPSIQLAYDIRTARVT
jgi:UDP-N-acetyl-2-amino-2-deoxyglucuronate dehydrogenase